MSDESAPSVTVNAAPASSPAPIIMPSPPPADTPEEVPGRWQARHAMWAATILLMGCIILAGCDVLKFFTLWTEAWYSIVTACGVILGLKPGKEIALAAVNRPKVVT